MNTDRDIDLNYIYILDSELSSEANYKFYNRFSEFNDL